MQIEVPQDALQADPLSIKLSKNAQKKAARKREKQAKRKAEIERLSREMISERAKNDHVLDASVQACTHGDITSNNVLVGGKASRARRVRNGEKYVGSCDDHRPAGGAPVSILPEHEEIVFALEQEETLARTRFIPHLLERKVVPSDNHGSMEMVVPSKKQKSTTDASTMCTTECCFIDGKCLLSEFNLRSFSISLISTSTPSSDICTSLLSLSCLDLSRNELWDLPDLSILVNLSKLDLSRNWFRDLPGSAISGLSSLTSLHASHNMLRSSRNSLQIATLKTLSALALLDISFNQKCGRQTLADMIQREVPQLVELTITINFPRPEGAFVGDSAADRDATLIRSQLEPWSTTALRRRLVADFGGDVSPPEVPRSDVMKRLLKHYSDEGNNRIYMKVDGKLVEETTKDELLLALKVWSKASVGGNQERTSIKAENYMILASPAEFSIGSKKAAKAAAKLCLHKTIWNLAHKAMVSVDPIFAQKYTALAVTHGFQGSPHIDRQNVGPFYGLALGDFDEGTGGIQVECSARVVVTVNTKNKLGKVDGRFPHWVAPYDTEKLRYSLIYYQTTGESEPVGPAVFSVPVAC